MGASIIDDLPASILLGVGISFSPTTDPATGVVTSNGNPGLMLAFMLAAFLFAFWNRWLRAGKTGQSIGKQALGLRLVDEVTGQSIGAGKAFLRDIAHILDKILYIGYLWPLWDQKRQTFADKIIGSIVIRAK